VKILVRATNWIGDAVMSIPALQAIGRHWPAAEITVLARPGVADLYRGQGFAPRVIVYDHRGKHDGIRGKERLATDLRHEEFDAALLLQNAFDAAWLAWRARIPERIGYARDARSWLLTCAIPVPRTGETPPHEMYYYLELVRRAGWLSALPEVSHISLDVPGDVRRTASKRLIEAGASNGKRRVAFAAGAAYGSAKCWPPERYAALADALIASCDADVILFGAAQENETAARITGAMRRKAVNLVGATTPAELAALLAECSLFIGNDSGAMHVAAAVRLPVVAIFGPTDPEGTSAVTPRFVLVRQAVSCSPCFLRQCPIDHRCMTRVTVEEVFAVVKEQLGRTPEVTLRNEERRA
jgi:heptosyltransferase-2